MHRLLKDVLEIKLSLIESKPARDAVDIALGECMLVLDTFGKKPEDFAMIADIFINDLADLPGGEVVNQIYLWRKNKTVFPKPADIRMAVEASLESMLMDITTMSDEEYRQKFLGIPKRQD